MGDSEESEVFEVSREVTNWTMPEEGDELGSGSDGFDYSTEGYWRLYSSSNASFNGSVEGNKTSGSDFKRDEELAKVEMAVLALIFILTVLGNCVVLLGIFFRRQKMTRMYYFILHLSVADLITAFFNVLTQLFWEITYRFQGGNFLCKFVKYTQILGPYSSSYVLVMTALDRYQAICFPLSNCTWTAKRSKVMLGLAWTISLLFCVPQMFIFSYQLVKPATETEPAEYDCWATFPDYWGDKAYVTWYSITVFVIPLIILVFAYSCITRAIWINFNMKAASRNHDNYERRMTRQDSDDGDGPSQYEHSMDESVFQREERLSLRANASHSVHGNTPGRRAININLYNPSKHFLTTKTSTTSTTSDGIDNSCDSTIDFQSRGSTNDSRSRAANPKIANRISTSSCATQSSTLSPNLSHRMSAPEDKGCARNENRSSLHFASQKMFAPNGNDRDGADNGVTQQLHYPDEEQLQLIPRAVSRNELTHISAPGKKVCHSSSPSPDKSESEGNNGNGTNLKNGSARAPGAYDMCHHGCYGKRCNFCHTDPSTGTKAGGSLEKELAGEIEQIHVKQSSPSSRSTIATDRDREHDQSYRYSGNSSSRHLLLPSKIRFSRKGNRSGRASISGGGGSGGGNRHSNKSSMATAVHQQPRTHSVKGISRAKIKTIKLTVTIICCYIFCSSPFIAAQLWAVYDPYASSSPFFTGPTFTILMLLASLNSCVNPYIFLFFNPNLLENCFRGIFRPKFPARRFNNGSPISRSMSQHKKAQFGVSGAATSVGRHGAGTTSLRKEPTRASQTSAGGSNSNGRRSENSQAYHPSSLTHSSPLINREEKARAHHRVSSPNDFEKGYLGELSERNEKGSSSSNGGALELTDSVPTSTFPITNGPTKQEQYPPGSLQPCRAETALAGNKSHVATSTLIT